MEKKLNSASTIAAQKGILRDARAMRQVNRVQGVHIPRVRLEAQNHRVLRNYRAMYVPGKRTEMLQITRAEKVHIGNKNSSVLRQTAKQKREFEPKLALKAAHEGVKHSADALRAGARAIANEAQAPRATPILAAQGVKRMDMLAAKIAGRIVQKSAIPAKAQAQRIERRQNTGQTQNAGSIQGVIRTQNASRVLNEKTRTHIGSSALKITQNRSVPQARAQNGVRSASAAQGMSVLAAQGTGGGRAGGHIPRRTSGAMLQTRSTSGASAIQMRIPSTNNMSVAQTVTQSGQRQGETVAARGGRRIASVAQGSNTKGDYALPAGQNGAMADMPASRASPAAARRTGMKPSDIADALKTILLEQAAAHTAMSYSWVGG